MKQKPGSKQFDIHLKCLTFSHFTYIYFLFFLGDSPDCNLHLHDDFMDFWVACVKKNIFSNLQADRTAVKNVENAVIKRKYQRKN